MTRVIRPRRRLLRKSGGASTSLFLRPEDFRAVSLPATELGFRFDAFLEFAYLSDYWREPGASRYRAPASGREKVERDVEKIVRYLRDGVCTTGYVIVFEECDWEFPPGFKPEAEARGCRLRFIRSY
jgi:hypothetical protein